MNYHPLVGRRRRAIGFLEGEDWLDAKPSFDELEKKERETLHNRFNNWLDGGVFKKYHHGFNAPKHRKCYVFKFQGLRLYGFLCNPTALDPGFQLCVLTSSTNKRQFETETVY